MPDQDAKTKKQGERRDWHTLGIEDALGLFEADAERGLGADQASSGLERFGPNALPEAARRPFGAVFLSQLKSPLIYLLVIAALVAFWLDHRTDAVVIFFVVLLNAVIGSVQEGR